MSSARARRPSSSRLVTTVAVVEDDPSVRHALMRILRGGGLTVAPFSSAEELLPVYEFARPRCLVVDLNLPGISGADLVENLRATGQLPPTVFVTGQPNAAHWLAQRGLGDIPCLEKSFAPAQLLELVRQRLGGSRSRT
jgi:FixJ family two-component response regulator